LTMCLVIGHYFDSVFCLSRAELRSSAWNNNLQTRVQI
jgi:hypothetical protein